LDIQADSVEPQQAQRQRKSNELIAFVDTKGTGFGVRKSWLSDWTEAAYTCLVSPVIVTRQPELRSKLLYKRPPDHLPVFTTSSSLQSSTCSIAPLALSPASPPYHQRIIMSQTLSHTEVLQAPAEDIWEACKHADKILCDLMPEYFAKSEFEQGHGEPGSIRVITMGPGV